MKILFCIPNLFYGGAERQLSYLVGALAEAGHEVHVASSRGGVNLEKILSRGARWHRLGGFSNRDPIIFLRLLGLIRRLKPDIVQTILAPMDIMGGTAALLTGTPWVLKESSCALNYQKGLREKIRRSLGKRADVVISNSPGGDKYWEAAGQRRRRLIPNAVPFGEINDNDSTEERNLSTIFSTGQKIILLAGRMDAGKNFAAALAALAELADEIPFVVFFCGDGPQRVALEKSAKNYNLERRVFFPGYVSNLWSLMKSADVFVSLSRFEGCPNVVLEAAACGCPLIISDIAAHRDLLDETGALFVDPNDVSAAAKAIKETLLDGGEVARERARRARAAVAGMPVEEKTNCYEKSYIEIIQNVSARKFQTCEF